MKKTLTAILTTAALLLSASPATANAEIMGEFRRKYDLNDDGKIDSVDASMVLAEYAKLSVGGEGSFTKTQLYLADCDNNYKNDSVDASKILEIYSINSAAKIESEEYPLTTTAFSYQVRYGYDVKSGGLITSYEEAYEKMQEAKEEIRVKERQQWKKASIILITTEKTELPSVRNRTIFTEEYNG